MVTIYSISLGCPKNRVDTERTLGGLAGGKFVDSPNNADCIFINTCGFIAPAVNESVRTIVEHIKLVQDKEDGKKPLLVVAGCLVGRYGISSLLPDLPEVDLFLDNSTLEHWSSLIREQLELRSRMSEDKSFPIPRVLSTSPSYAWLKISDGCRHACSFCTIPSIRGKLKSSPIETLVAEAQFIVQQGVKELIIVGQDVTDWGKDCKKNLENLLENIVTIPDLYWLRLMYLYPAGITDNLLQFLRSAGAPFVPYFDIPVQHASSSVLSRMGRPFATDPRKAIDRVRNYFPDAALRTSLIVGFPGETEEDYEELCSFVSDVRFHHLGVFAYQQEEGTPAATMPDQVPDRTKEWRRDYLMDIQGDISEEILAEYTGQHLDVLVDSVHEEWPGLHTGRTWFQTPESDGITYISGPGVFPGAVVNADITESQTYDLVALADGIEER